MAAYKQLYEENIIVISNSLLIKVKPYQELNWFTYWPFRSDYAQFPIVIIAVVIVLKYATLRSAIITINQKHIINCFEC